MNDRRRAGARSLAALACLAVIGAAPTAAQTPEPAPPPVLATPDTPTAEPARAGNTRRLTLELTASGLFDSNVGHDEEELSAIGMMTGVEAQFGSRLGALVYALTGGVAVHNYTRTDTWDRVSKLAAAAAELPLLGRLSAGMLVELSLAGANEDRVVSDQLMFSPRLYYRFGRGGVARLYGAHRLRESQSEAKSTNQYLGLALRTASGSRPYLELSTRFERNDADEALNDFDRQTHSAGFWFPVGDAIRLGAGLQYTRQEYSNRLLEIEPEDPEDEPLLSDEVRVDTKWTPELMLRWDIARRVRLDGGYEFERRTSTDPDKDYTAHVFELSTRYRW